MSITVRLSATPACQAHEHAVKILPPNKCCTSSQRSQVLAEGMSVHILQVPNCLCSDLDPSGLASFILDPREQPSTQSGSTTASTR